MGRKGGSGYQLLNIISFLPVQKQPMTHRVLFITFCSTTQHSANWICCRPQMTKLEIWIRKKQFFSVTGSCMTQGETIFDTLCFNLNAISKNSRNKVTNPKCNILPLEPFKNNCNRPYMLLWRQGYSSGYRFRNITYVSHNSTVIKQPNLSHSPLNAVGDCSFILPSEIPQVYSLCQREFSTQATQCFIFQFPVFSIYYK